MRSLSTATDSPSASPVSPSWDVSFACSTHSCPVRSKTYAAPAFSPFGSASVRAATTAVVPSSATAEPTESPPSAPSGAKLAVCVHSPSAWSNTYAAPAWSSPARRAPTSTRSPSTATADPKRAPAPVPAGDSVARWTSADCDCGCARPPAVTVACVPIQPPAAARSTPRRVSAVRSLFVGLLSSLVCVLSLMIRGGSWVVCRGH